MLRFQRKDEKATIHFPSEVACADSGNSRERFSGEKESERERVCVYAHEGEKSCSGEGKRSVGGWLFNPVCWSGIFLEYVRAANSRERWFEQRARNENVSELAREREGGVKK